ncbi:MAG: ATP-binding protein [Sporolactobacillus sp.]
MTKEIEQSNKRRPLLKKTHTLYVYDRPQEYVSHAVSFICAVINHGDNVFFYDDEVWQQTISEATKDGLNAQQIERFHFRPLSSSAKRFKIKHIQQLIDEIIQSAKACGEHVQLWLHVTIESKLSIAEEQIIISETNRLLLHVPMVLVCAIDGTKISARLENELKKYYEWFMTDENLVMSNLYDWRKLHDVEYEIAKDELPAVGEWRATQTQLESFIIDYLDPIIIFKQNGEIVAVNRAFEAFLGWDIDDIIGTKAERLPILKSIPSNVLTRMLLTVQSNKQNQSEEITLQTRAGIIVNMQMTGYPLTDSKGNVNGCIITLHDMTAMKQARRLLLQSEKLSEAGELAAGIAHEIRNPVTAIKGFLQLMKHEQIKKHDYFAIIEEEISHVETTLNELIVLAKPKISNVGCHCLNDLIHEAMLLLGAQADLRLVTFKTEFDDEAAMMKCERQQIKQICICFLQNAIEAMPNGGVIRVQIRCKAHHLVLRFIDHGDGIAGDLLKKIGHSLFTTKRSGTGLGCMLSSEIIKKHGGTLRIFSKVRQGTIVDVRFPKPILQTSNR